LESLRLDECDVARVRIAVAEVAVALQPLAGMSDREFDPMRLLAVNGREVDRFDRAYWGCHVRRLFCRIAGRALARFILSAMHISNIERDNRVTGRLPPALGTAPSGWRSVATTVV